MFLHSKIDKNFTIYDETDSLAVIKQGIKKLNLDDKIYAPKLVKTVISNAKNKMQDAYTFATFARDFKSQNIAKIFEYYENALNNNNAIDFDDMLMLAVKLLEQNPNDAYTLFQIGQSEYILGNVETSRDMYERGLALNPSTECLYVQIMIESLAKNYCKLDRGEEALALMEKYADQCKYARYVYTHACVLLDNGQKLKALLFFVKATLMPDVDTLGESLLKCYEYVIRLYLDMGDTQMAEVFREKYETCLAERERVLSA